MKTINVNLPVHTGYTRMEMRIYSNFIYQCLKDQYPSFTPLVKLIDEDAFTVEVKVDNNTDLEIKIRDEITAAVPKWFSEWKPHLIMSGIPVWFGEKQWK